MKESATYQAIVEEGEVKALQGMLLRLGRKKFGSPNKSSKKAIESTLEVARLEALCERLLEVKSWQELFN